MAAGIGGILEELRATSWGERDKGDRFERLMRAFLTTEPLYRDLYSDVWLWRDYPGRDGRTDTGVDLVARARDTGEHTAIQCKFFSPSTQVTKPMLDSFLSASGKYRGGAPEFSSRLVISTSDRWGRNAEDAIKGQNPPVSVLGTGDLEESTIDWSRFSLASPEHLARKEPKKAFPHQLEAIRDVVAGFEGADRGKLVMACGTGKTFTSLRIAEAMVPEGGAVLFLVPSISLLSQTLREWTADAAAPLHSFAVCSDTSVGKRKDDEDIQLTDLAFPATTDPARLGRQFRARPSHSAARTVVFSTYQSLEVVARAQEAGDVPEFDLVVCDEAHRTTGVTLAGADESAFVRVHDQAYLKGAKRLYMTATPRVFGESAKAKADDAGAVLADMADEDKFGQEFYRLGFGQAVSIGRLTDYKVLVLAVDESYVSRRFQHLLADENNELSLDDAAKIVGCWNGLSKRAMTADEFSQDPEPMRRAVAFARDIRTSKKLAAMFQHVVQAEIDAIAEDDDQDEDAADQRLLRCDAEHVDGTFNVLARNQKLDWLKADPGPGRARILTNARCLSEGVDVPALDAVMFLNPRDSVVDVVQSVGRVMRKLQGKKYGYVVLPVGIPSDVDPATALNDHKKYKVVWQVLQALRSHDERFDAEVNKIDLTGKTDRLQVGVIGKGGNPADRDRDGADTALQLDFPDLDQWRDAILAKIVQKVGNRRYWEDWATDVADMARRQITRITDLVHGSDQELQAEFGRFVKGLQDNLNPQVTEKDAIEALSQHLITAPVFDALFAGYDFTGSNPVSQAMQAMADALEGQHLETETERLDGFYESVRVRASKIDDPADRQAVVKELYERFFQRAFTGTSDRLGIVYTPNEVVDFIIRSVQAALQEEFGASLTDQGVHVLDPFTGTGTFIVRLLQSGLIRPEDLERKYRHELHANEIVLLAYYVAAITIEEAYHGLAGGGYVPFDGIVLTDTFQTTETDDQDELDGMAVFPENNQRVEAQKKLDIRVILGNPPYSKGQESGNDDNQNLSYPTLDGRIAATYAAASTAQNKNSLYDSYIRAIRWASDRIGDRGILAYVSNGGFIDGNTADGLRKTLVQEFSRLYVLNLRGNQRTAGEQSRKEGGKIFGSGSRATVAIYLLVKNPDTPADGTIHYRDIGDYLTREQKLAALRDAADHTGIQWDTITPNTAGDWINQRNPEFDNFTLLASKDKADAGKPRFLETYSAGLKTNRDAWVYNYSQERLADNAQRMIGFYNRQADEAAQARTAGQPWQRDNDPKKISWGDGLVSRLRRGQRLDYARTNMRRSIYRPFCAQHLYFDPAALERTYQLPKLFPTPDTDNWGFYLNGTYSTSEFAVLAMGLIPCLDIYGKGGQFFPRYSFETAEHGRQQLGMFDGDGGGRRVDNVTDGILADYQATYGAGVTKDDIFHYLYGILHSPDYRARYRADLRKMLPRIPKVRDFHAFADAGRKLADLHLGYETADPYPLREERSVRADNRVQKMRYAKHGKAVDRTTIVYNDGITLTGIPLAAQEYMLGSRSALDWVVERYQVKTDKASGILNDPNDWGEEHGDPRYILDLIARVTTVSVETVRIVNTLPSLTPINEEAFRCQSM